MPIHVLVADDHTILFDGLKALLNAKPDIDVVGHAMTGLDVLATVAKVNVDIVIMDIAMPEMNGLTAIEHLTADYPTVKVIVLSMHITAEHVYQAVRSGAMGYVLKESAGQELVQAIRQVWKGNRYFSTRVSSVMMDDYMRLRAASMDQSPLEKLTVREQEVLQLVVEGQSSAEIAKKLNLSKSTVDTYRSRIMRKLHTKTLTELVKFAVQHGLTTP